LRTDFDWQKYRLPRRRFSSARTERTIYKWRARTVPRAVASGCVLRLKARVMKLRPALDHDLVVIHDPQPLPLITHYKKKSPWVWRCHIDLYNSFETVFRLKS
jgi:hypothetical protein